MLLKFLAFFSGSGGMTNAGYMTSKYDLRSSNSLYLLHRDVGGSLYPGISESVTLKKRENYGRIRWYFFTLHYSNYLVST